MKSAAMCWQRLHWPREVLPEQLVQLTRLLAGSGARPVIVEVVGSCGSVEHRLALPSGYGGVLEQLRAALPGVSIEAMAERPLLQVRHAVELRLSTDRRALRSDDPTAVSRALLTALSDLHRGEQLVIQWLLVRPLSAAVVPSRLTSLGPESWVTALLLAPLAPPRPLDSDVRQALRIKQQEPGWRASARIGVASGSAARERQLVRQVMGALASCEAPGVRWWVKVTNTKRVRSATRGWRSPLKLNVQELMVVSSFPVGPTAELPVSRIGSRLVAPMSAISRRGRVVGRATFPGKQRPLALTPKDSCRHVHLIAPTGASKSTLLLNLMAQDIAAGRAVVCFDPKGDLITDTLGVITPERVKDVVVIDPNDDRPVGLNPLALSGRSAELVADQLLGLWHALYASSWGPRTADILSASFLTLAKAPGMTLAALPVLLTNAGFRRRLVSKINDPIGLQPFWAAYENWSEQERLTAISPSMNKLRPLLVNPAIRGVIGQSRPRFALRQVFTERKILLVNLSKGDLGPETSSLLGALIFSQLWQAILGRSAIPPERRHPVTIVVDEFQDYVRLPLDFADALAQARGLGGAFHLANQYLHQLEPAMRAAVLANAQSRIAWRLPSADARVLASGSSLAPEDFQSLGAFQAYAQLVANDAVQPWCSLETLPPPTQVSDPDAVRLASRERYGTTRAEVEAELHKLFFGRSETTADDLTPRQRTPRGPHA